METYDFTINGALQKGRLEGRQEVALSLLKLGIAIEQISQATKLSKTEILKLQSNNNIKKNKALEK